MALLVPKKRVVAEVFIEYFITDSNKRSTELASFRKIDDGYPKIVLTMDNDPFVDLGDGYQKINVLDWLIQ